MCVCVCARESHKHRCVFVWGQIPSFFQRKGGLGLSTACALTEPALLLAVHTPAIRQAAKQTDEVNRETFPRVFWDVTATDATLTPTLDTVWQPTVSTQPAPLWLILKEGGGSGGWHCAHDHTQDNVCQQQQRCRYIRETKTDNGGWFHGAVMLHVQSSKDFHMWGGGGGLQSVFRGADFDLLCVWFNLRGELRPLHTARSKSHYLNAILSMIFSYRPHLSNISPHCHPDRQTESTACWLTEFLALSSSRGWSEGVSVSR